LASAARAGGGRNEGRTYGDAFIGMRAVDGDAGDCSIAVTDCSALSLSAVWTATQILSDALVGLPVHIRDKANAKIDDHPIAALLRNDGEANEYMDSVTFKSAMMAGVALWGNGYAYIERDGTGAPIALYPLPAGQTRARRRDGEFVYVTRVKESFTIAAQDVLHIRGPISFDGITALSPIEYQRQTIGLSLALERFASKFFRQGGNVGGIIETPPMKEEAQKNFIETWRAPTAGPDAAFKIAALTGGFKFIARRPIRRNRRRWKAAFIKSARSRAFGASRRTAGRS
jgi:HK97 family phage portal protein